MVSPKTPSMQYKLSLHGPSADIPPGTWRHPKFDEIARRQDRSTFTDRNLQKVIWNGSILLVIWVLGWCLEPWFNMPLWIQPLWQYRTYVALAARAVLLINILFAMLPVIGPKDELTDIPLTPSQRALLGLNPNATPQQATPTSQYSTPPRYPRSSTPRTENSEGRGSNYSSSPLSGKGSPTLGKSYAEPAYSPAISPLLQRAITGGSRDASRRRSSGLSSYQALESSLLDSSLISLPSTPSPPDGKGAGLVLSNKWLYERGRQSPVGLPAYT
ncbi:MAG: hypothetical protein M1816_000319 [Peltula sp. TS41687]|nr:MAG: hypothetical protein M1816_000319 [Peltula sp. TS41687]